MDTERKGVGYQGKVGKGGLDSTDSGASAVHGSAGEIVLWLSADEALSRSRSVEEKSGKKIGKGWKKGRQGQWKWEKRVGGDTRPARCCTEEG